MYRIRKLVNFFLQSLTTTFVPQMTSCGWLSLIGAESERTSTIGSNYSKKNRHCIQWLSIVFVFFFFIYSHDPSQWPLGACDDPDECPYERAMVFREYLIVAYESIPSSSAFHNSMANSNRCRECECCWPATGWSKECPATLVHRNSQREYSRCRYCYVHWHPHAMVSPCHCFATNYLNQSKQMTQWNERDQILIERLECKKLHIFELTISDWCAQCTLRWSLRCSRSSATCSRRRFWLTRLLAVYIFSDATRPFRRRTIWTGHLVHEYLSLSHTCRLTMNVNSNFFAISFKQDEKYFACGKIQFNYGKIMKHTKCKMNILKYKQRTAADSVNLARRTKCQNDSERFV